ncbi:MAG: bifunctional (p)ppGpp synthetase/guanosine-3',5'-bis(diphosphate) 3'-pyrophosphohydrolase [Rhodothermales bacterium]
MIEVSDILKNADIHVEPEYVQKLDDLLVLCRKHLLSVNEELVERAFRLSYWAHRNDRRASGELYINHPLAVAAIVAKDISFDDISVAAALLHDVVEDTELSIEFIKQEFGETLAIIIDGLTKIDGVFASREMGQAENVRKLMLSMASDIRVILVKFADRLHNMRTLDSLPRKKQIKIASETLDLFAPLAHRFGLFAIKGELEDLTLKILKPDSYFEIAEGLSDTKRFRSDYVNSFIEPLQEQLKGKGFEFEIYGRPKHIYSIHRKMLRQDKPLEEIYDLFAIRIVLKSTGKRGKEDCWRVYSIITDLYRPLTERFRDFISVPKSNGYQSLHTTVLGPQGRRVEVQIRTEEMHAIAERGLAAHWKYKEGVSNASEHVDQWLSWVRDLLENPRPEQATEFVQEFRLNLYDEEIYVFSPKGDLYNLPSKATPVDFAYLVHTEVGNRCIGAKVNGKMVPLSKRLKSGDQVEVITSKKQTPRPDWVKFVVTHKAKSRIRHWINEERRHITEVGQDIWRKKSKRSRIHIDDRELQRYAKRFKFPSPQQMFYEIGAGLFDVKELIKFIKNKEADTAAEADTDEKAVPLQVRYDTFLDKAQSIGKPALKIDGELHTDIVTQYATCCNPIPGDEVFGFLSKTGSINIHRVGCKNAAYLLVNHHDRILQVEWSRQKDVQFVSALRLIGEDRVGLLNDISTVISKNLKTNIRSMTIDSDEGVFEGTLVLSVNDLEHLGRLMERLRRIDSIHGVYRFEE